MRRNVIRVGMAYLVAGWMVLQIADVLIGFLDLPGWSGKLLVITLAVGFPLALVFAWAFELTPEGLKTEAEAQASGLSRGVVAKKLNVITIALVVIALAVFGADRYWLSARPGAEPHAASREAAPLEASVAVLPFDNISRDEANDPFTIGIHDDLITQISKISSLRTISRTSVLRYGERLKPLREIAADLGVATILEGSVQRAGDLVRINVQLTAADSGSQLWGERYERQLSATNIFDIQSEIVKAIADALYAKLTPTEAVRIAKTPTRNLAALEQYFLGRQSMEGRHSEALQEAIGYFEQAIALDPGFALAYIGLSDSYQLQEDGGGLARDEMLVLAMAAINKALELDRDLGPAYNSLAGITFGEGDYPQAETLFRKSIELNPNYARAYLWYGLMLVDMGRIDEAIIQYRKGIERDPLSSQLLESLGTAMEYQGRFDDALKQYRKSIEVNTTFATSYTYIGNVHWLVYGQISEAIACHRKSIELDSGARLPQAYLGLLYLDLGQAQGAERWISGALALAPDSLESRAAMALLRNYLGDEEAWVGYANDVQEINPYYPDARLMQTMTLALLRNRELRAGRIIEARDGYARNYSRLLRDEAPTIDWQNYRAAIDLAAVLLKSGEAERAHRLLNGSLDLIESGTVTRLGMGGYGIADVEIHALKGQGDLAVAALKQAIAQGWRGLWWFFLQRNPNLESMQDRADFRALVQELESGWAEQGQSLDESVSCPG